MAKHNCDTCRFRARYDRNPRSLLGRFWRWHIRFCPGWKAYFQAQSPEQQLALATRYSLPTSQD